MGDDSTKRVRIALQGQFRIAGEIFHAVFVTGRDGQVMSAVWKNKDERSFSLSQVTEELHIPLPDCMNFTITMVSMDLSYHLRNKALGFHVISREYGTLSFQKTVGYPKNRYQFRWDVGRQFFLHDLPVIGKYMAAGDFIAIGSILLQFLEDGQAVFGFEGAIQGLGQSEKSFQIGHMEDVQAKGEARFLESGAGLADRKSSPVKQQLSVRGLSAAKQNPSGNRLSAAKQGTSGNELPAAGKKAADEKLPQERTDIHWLELQKDMGIFHFRRLGFAMEDGKIRLYLNAGFTLSVLEMEFMELYVAFSFQKKQKPDFGLKGLAVSLERDPFYLSGGLYIGTDGVYNGMLTVRFQKFSMTALASYGKLPGSLAASFFAYLAVCYPLGGIPAFFVTGLAAGFGVHRAIRIPDVKGVMDFPLVKAAMGLGMRAEDAAQALESMQDIIYISEGSYFISAGIRFTCFRMIQAFALLNVQFGSRTEISLLGVADASFPPNVEKPIAFIRLLLRLVFAPDDGYFQMSGALTQDSYLLDRACRLEGGFAVYLWFKGEHRGDFVLSAGGYHPNFHCSHYPSVDRVGINWTVNGNLSIKGEGYFALTPGCIMAGGKLEVLYTAGKLRAWCRAFANIMIGWRPFYYDIALGVSLGASYRVDFLLIHKTFTLELSADMRIRGPEFSGYVHIKWFIISFTITFGNAKEAERSIDWNTFAQNFLQDGEPAGKQEGNLIVPQLCTIRVARGLFGQKENSSTKKVESYHVNGRDLVLEIESKMPCSKIEFQEKELEQQSKKKFGILPMHLKELSVTLSVTIKRRGKDGTGLLLDGKMIRQNMPAALWGTQEISLQNRMMENMPAGLRIQAQEQKRSMLPGSYTGDDEDGYLLSDLTRNHRIDAPEHFSWNKKEAPAGKEEWRGKKGIVLMEESIENNPVRRQYLQELRGYGTYMEDEVQLCQYRQHLRTILWAPPIIQRTGSRGDYEERDKRAAQCSGSRYLER